MAARGQGESAGEGLQRMGAAGRKKSRKKSRKEGRRKGQGGMRARAQAARGEGAAAGAASEARGASGRRGGGCGGAGKYAGKMRGNVRAPAKRANKVGVADQHLGLSKGLAAFLHPVKVAGAECEAPGGRTATGGPITLVRSARLEPYNTK